MVEKIECEDPRNCKNQKEYQAIEKREYLQK